MKVSGVSVQALDLAPRFPDTRNLTPKFYKLRYSFPGGATFSEYSLGKSPVPTLLKSHHVCTWFMPSPDWIF